MFPQLIEEHKTSEALSNGHLGSESFTNREDLVSSLKRISDGYNLLGPGADWIN